MIYGRDELQPWEIAIPNAPVDTSSALKLEALHTIESGPTAHLSNYLQFHPDALYLLPLYQPKLQNLSREYLGKQKFLTEDEAKNSEYYRPGIKTSGGIFEKDLMHKAKMYDQQRTMQLELANMPQRFTGHLAEIGVSFAAQFADPITDVSLFAVPELVGAKASPLIYGIKNSGLRTLAKAGFGAFEGAAFTAPQLGADYIDGDDLSIAQILSTAALNSGLQGVIRVAVGVKRPISDTSAKLIAQTAINQGFDGKLPELDAMLKQAYYGARIPGSGLTRIDIPDDLLKANIAPILSEETKKEISDALRPHLESLAAKRLKNKDLKKLLTEKQDAELELKKHLRQVKKDKTKSKFASAKAKEKQRLGNKKRTAEIKKRIESHEAKLNKNSDFVEAKKQLKGLESNYYPVKIKSLLDNIGVNVNELNKIIDANAGEPAPYSQTSIDVLSNIRDKAVDEHNKLGDLLKQSGASDKDLNANHLPRLVNDFVNDMQKEEPEKISSNTIKIMKGDYPPYVLAIASKLSKGLIHDDLFSDERELINKSREVLQDVDPDENNPYFEKVLKALNDREKELDSIEDSAGMMGSSIQIWQSFESRIKLLNKAIRDNKAFKMMEEGSGIPISKGDLIASADKVAQSDSDFAAFPDLEEVGEQELANAESEDKDIDNKIKDIEANIDKLELPAEARKEIESLTNKIKEADTIKSALSKMTECLISGGE